MKALALLLAALAASLPATPAFADESLAQCLTRKGWVFYGASWCGQCRKQIKLFGDTARQLPYVECSMDGTRDGQTPYCQAAAIQGYPTWEAPDGSRGSGVYSTAALARASGCPAG